MSILGDIMKPPVRFIERPRPFETSYNFFSSKDNSVALAFSKNFDYVLFSINNFNWQNIPEYDYENVRVMIDEIL